MRLPTFLTTSLLLAVSLLGAPGCATRASTPPVFPPAADLRVKPKPQLAPEDLASEAALDRHEIALEAWGEEGWRQVARVCRWAVANGAELPFACPPPDS